MSDIGTRRAIGRAIWAHCCAAVLSVGAAGGAAADSSRVEITDYWRVVEVTGAVRMLAGENAWNTEARLAVGDIVGPYQSIAAGGDGQAILVRGEDIIVVHADAVIALPPPADDVAETRIVQSGGSAFYDVDPRPSPDFAVTTPYMIVGVKGTQFALDEGGSRLAVIEGLVGAQDGTSGAGDDVAAGEGIAVVPGEAFVARPLDGTVLAALTGQALLIDSRRGNWNTILDGAETNEAGSAGSAGSPGGGAGGGVGGAAGGVGGAVGGAVGGIGGAVGGAAGGVGEAVGGAVGGVGEAVGGAVGGAGEAVGGAVGGAGEAVGGALGGL